MMSERIGFKSSHKRKAKMPSRKPNWRKTASSASISLAYRKTKK